MEDRSNGPTQVKSTRNEDNKLAEDGKAFSTGVLSVCHDVFCGAHRGESKIKQKEFKREFGTGAPSVQPKRILPHLERQDTLPILVYLAACKVTKTALGFPNPKLAYRMTLHANLTEGLERP